MPKAPGSTSSTGVESGNGTNISEGLGPTPPVVSMVSKHSNGMYCFSQLNEFTSALRSCSMI